MPPSIVLEVMKILSAEIALREETRNLEQARPQLQTAKYKTGSESLQNTQEELADRTEAVIETIIDLPEGEKKFGKEIKQLTNASRAMWDAADILSAPDTGPKAMGAETEAIEWLLRAKRSSKGGGGGGGSNPGDGSRTGKDTNIAALALLGETDEDKAKVVEKQIQQATGKTGKELPEEYSRGLDKYFELLEGNE